MIKINDVRTGDVFSENSHFICDSVDGSNVKFIHLQSGQSVTLSHGYVEQFLKTADQYQSEVKVGKLDKLWTQKQIDEAKKKGENVDDVRVGDVRVKGIRTIFEEIYSADVFTVCFLKQDKQLTKKAYDDKVKKVIENALSEIEFARRSKKSVANAASDILENLIRNPVLTYEPGEERILRGYKLQFSSRDGYYSCMDMGIKEARSVNINTIQWLVYDGVKYILE